jgi:general secretion pathway protein I
LILSKPNESGFSLVEALVALAVFAMAGVAIVQMQSSSLSTFARVESRALADLLAQNTLTQMVSSQTPPSVGARQETLEFAQRQWRRSTSVTEVPGAQTRRITVEVSAVDAPALARVSAFVVAPETP